MSGAKPIQMILARQLASCVAMPILLVDTEGTLVFYNEAAERIMNRRFDETGEISAQELVELVEVLDADRNPIPTEDRPTHLARREGQPVAREIWTRSPESDWHHLQVTALPLVGEGGALFGIMHIFWEI